MKVLILVSLLGLTFQAIAKDKVKKPRYKSGKRIDFERASTIFINEFRDGKLGSMSLETPEVIEKEIEQVAVMKAEKEEREKRRLEEKAARKRKTKANRR